MTPTEDVPRGKLSASSDIVIEYTCGCYVRFVNANPDIARFDKPCHKHRNLEVFDTMKICLEASNAYKVDQGQFRRISPNVVQRVSS